jgi:hypothetical protein
MIAKRFHARCIALLLIAHAVSASALAQSDVAEAQIHLREAGQAYQDGDFDAFASSLETARALNPYSLATQYNLACAYARTGRKEDALRLLRGLVAARVDYGMADDPDLEALRGEAEFTALLASLEQSLAPIANSTHEFTIEQLGLLPEGIAIDADTSRIFVGSMRSGDIFVLDVQGQLSKFTTVEHEGTLAAIGLYVDGDSDTLWAIGTSFNLNEDFDPQAPVRAGVFGFDLASGQLKKKLLAADPGDGFNDVTLAATGDMYLSGSTLSIVRAGSDRIEPIATSLPIVGSNGVALSPDGSRLYVTSYPVGVALVDTVNGKTTWLSAPENTTLYGIDGLYWYRGDLIGVQNGVRPWRLVRIDLDNDGTAITAVELLEFANPGITPTTGAIDGERIYYVGEGPAPALIPAHFPPQMAGNAGKTIVMSAPLH